MIECGSMVPGAIEQYFYGELDAVARARVDAHLARCAACRQHVADLRAIRSALDAPPRVAAPARDDWSGFMARLEASTSPAHARRGAIPRAGWLALAATLVLAAAGVVLAGWSAAIPHPPAVAARAAVHAAPAPASTPSSTSAFVSSSEQHLERSKLVVLGLVTRDPRHTSPADWAYERQLAGSLLSDTRLYRQTAQARGLTDMAGVMGDLETVLLETSLSDHDDPDALARVQRLIRRRDLLVKMQVLGTSGTRGRT